MRVRTARKEGVFPAHLLAAFRADSVSEHHLEDEAAGCAGTATVEVHCLLGEWCWLHGSFLDRDSLLRTGRYRVRKRRL